MSAFSPRILPEITSVAIVDLAGMTPKSVKKFMKASIRANSVVVTGDKAKVIAELWRQLPSGSEMRCHIPPYGLRFFSDLECVCEASLCWVCNNIYGEFFGKPIHYEFNAGNQTSQELLSELRLAFQITR